MTEQIRPWGAVFHGPDGKGVEVPADMAGALYLSWDERGHADLKFGPEAPGIRRFVIEEPNWVYSVWIEEGRVVGAQAPGAQWVGCSSQELTHHLLEVGGDWEEMR